MSEKTTADLLREIAAANPEAHAAALGRGYASDGEYSSPVSAMSSDMYDEGYWERGDGSNYVNYGDDWGWIATIDSMESHIGPTATIFEVGAAKGWFLHAAMQRGYRCAGMDISQWAIDHAPPSVRPALHLGNAATDKIIGTYDVVCSWEMLEHVPFDELDAVLQNMEDAVRPGGWQYHRIGIDDGDRHGHFQDRTHQEPMPYDWWVDKFTERGWLRNAEAETELDRTFADRDWRGRFFAYQIPTTRSQA